MSSQGSLSSAMDVAIDQHSMHHSLQRLIRNIARDSALHEDLLQEALLHLWLIQTRRPGQTPSWYLQSCRFHLQHYLASGRSVDSTKRRAGQMQFAPESDEEDGIPEQADAGNSVVTSVSVRELMNLLAPLLSEQENAVLNCLADGLGPREIGRELKMSHTMVIRHRRRIASLLAKLEQPRSAPAIVNGFKRRLEEGFARPRLGKAMALAISEAA